MTWKMLQISVDAASPLIALLALALGIIGSALTGALADSGWRNTAKLEAELCKRMLEIADGEDDRAAIDKLKRCLFDKVEAKIERECSYRFGIRLITRHYMTTVITAAITAALVLASNGAVVSYLFEYIAIGTAFCLDYENLHSLRKGNLNARAPKHGKKRYRGYEPEWKRDD